VADKAHGLLWGRLLGRLLWARPSEQCDFLFIQNNFRRK
jgi:hypothetical protein